MKRIAGGVAALAGLFGVGCGHEAVTGSAQNNWATPVGHATATNPNYVDPNEPAFTPKKDRSVFAKSEAAPPPPARSVVEPADTAEPSGAVPPPIDAAPDIPTPNSGPGGVEAPPPYVLPPP